MSTTDVGRYSQDQTRYALRDAGYLGQYGQPLRLIPKAFRQRQGPADYLAVHPRDLLIHWAVKLSVQVKTAPLAGDPDGDGLPDYPVDDWNEHVTHAASIGYTPVLSVVRRHAGRQSHRGGARPSVVELYRMRGTRARNERMRLHLVRFYLREVTG